MKANDTTVALAEKLGRHLVAKGWQLTTAESCTGGGLGYAITAVAGSSAYFTQGFITYANQAKQHLLGVSSVALAQQGAVSEEVVKQMAHGAALKAGADMAVAISGIAGPDGGSPDKPVGTVWFGFVLPLQKHALVRQFEGDRHAVRAQAIDFALQHSLDLIDAYSSAPVNLDSFGSDD